jgi:adenylate cyclase class 2
MPFEVETKFAVADREALERRLAEVGARRLGSESHVDYYLQHPHRDFQKTDEALRIRQTDQGVVVTYKGPRAPAAVKIREEFELAVLSDRLEHARGLFERLGFRVLAVVRKNRTLYSCPARDRPVMICYDIVDGLGEFVEIEMIAEAEDVQSASASVADVANQLKLASPITASYLKMLLARDQIQFPWAGVEQPAI